MEISGSVTIGDTTSGDTVSSVIAALNVSDVSIGNGSTYFRKDGSGYLANESIKWDSGGTVTMKNIKATNCIFKNVKIEGTVRQPWTQSGIYINVGSDETMSFDNIAAGASGGWEDGSIESMITWTLNDSGRIIRIANWRWGNEIFNNTVTITAPNGKFFYEDGIAKSKIIFSREILTLIGYGDSTTFYGWVVIGRINFNTNYGYGRVLRSLAVGIVTQSGSSVSIKYNTYDNSILNVDHNGTGQYKISFPTSWGLEAGSYQVMLTGYNGSLRKATLNKPTNSSFEVQVSDDASENDGSFQFQIFNMNDWLG